MRFSDHGSAALAGLALVGVAALGGCSSAGSAAGPTVTVTRTVTAQPIAAPSAVDISPTPTVASSTATVQLGADLAGPACSTLHPDEVTSASNNSLIEIHGVPNPINRSDTCAWNLAPVADCGCASVGVTIDWGVSPASLGGLEQLWKQDIAAHRGVPIPGVAHGEISNNQDGLTASATFAKHGMWITVTTRMRYTWTPADIDVLKALDPLVYARAHAGKG